MLRNVFLTIISICFCVALQAQSIILTGPITGAVQPNSAKVYLRTVQPENFTIEYSTDSLFSTFEQMNVQTNAATFNTINILLNGLQSSTRYFYRFRAADGTLQAERGRFKTFPELGQPGHYKFIVGSCSYNNGPGGGHGNPFFKNDLMFQAMVDFDPLLFIHLGDWGYPPSELGSNHLLQPALAAASFDLRYRDPNMKQYIMPNMAIDFIYDDDYNQNGTAGRTYPTISRETLPNGDLKVVLKDVLHPPGLRDSCISAYFRHFPSYDQVDTSGIHHKFTVGNIDFIITDTRSSKSPVHAPFRYNSLLNSYSFSPPANHTTLGETQRIWLLNELKTSDADWKIIGSSVVFSKKMGDLMETVLLGQLFDKTLVEFATALAYMWGGYPKDQNALLKTIKDEKIENVVFISGDTHSSMMDDGKNSGIPELSSSGLSAGDEGFLNYTIDSLLKQLNLPITVKEYLWNGGGSGIDNRNFSDTYATLEFIGRDTLKMCIIDEFVQTLACMNIINTKAGTVTGFQTQIVQADDIFQLIYPNPAKETIRVLLKSDEKAICRVTDMQGRQMMADIVILPGQKSVDVDILSLPDGIYVLQYIRENATSSRKFVKK